MWGKIKQRLFKLKTRQDDGGAVHGIDLAGMEIGPLKVTMTRKALFPVPHEFSVFIPRVEIREKWSRGDVQYEREMLFNSLTIVHSPQRPPTESSRALNNKPRHDKTL